MGNGNWYDLKLTLKQGWARNGEEVSGNRGRSAGGGM
jgi:hypothetical protein